MIIKNSCVSGKILRTIYFKNKRLEQYAWHKEGDFIIKIDMLLPGFPIIFKYKIKKYLVNFYGEMSILDLIKHIHKWRTDPCHYNFHEALDLLVDTLERENLKYALNLAKYIQKRFKEELQIPNDTSEKLKQIYKHLKRKMRGFEYGCNII